MIAIRTSTKHIILIQSPTELLKKLRNRMKLAKGVKILQLTFKKIGNNTIKDKKKTKDNPP